MTEANRSDWTGAALVRIQHVRPHRDAERLDVAIIPGNIACVVMKGQFSKGDIALYLGVDGILPMDLAHLSPTKELRIRSVKLRGEMSYGVLHDPDTLEAALMTHLQPPDAMLFDGLDWHDITEGLRITRYCPPGGLGIQKGKSNGWYSDTCPAFSKPVPHYKGEAGLRPNEPVYVTEKLHGCNARYTLDTDGSLMSCSKNHRMYGDGDVWSRAGKAGGLKEALEKLRDLGYPGATLYGEVVGRGVQNLDYGYQEPTFFAFDLYYNGDYVSPELARAALDYAGVRQVPYLGVLVYDDYARALADGKTAVPGANHIREGVVFRPLQGRRDRFGGRIIVKAVSNTYRERLKGSERPEE